MDYTEYKLANLIRRRDVINAEIKELHKTVRRERGAKVLGRKIKKIVENNPHFHVAPFFKWEEEKTFKLHVFGFNTIIQDILLLQKLGKKIDVDESWSWYIDYDTQTSKYRTMWNITITTEPATETLTKEQILKKYSLIDSDHPLANQNLLHLIPLKDSGYSHMSMHRTRNSTILTHDCKDINKRIRTILDPNDPNCKVVTKYNRTDQSYTTTLTFKIREAVATS